MMICGSGTSRLRERLNICSYAFLYRRRSGNFNALSLPTGHLMAETTRTSTIEKSIFVDQKYRASGEKGAGIIGENTMTGLIQWS
jgi:hypothetical protein